MTMTMKAMPAPGGRFIEGADGAHLYVQTAGTPTSPALVLTHGVLQSSQCWRHQYAHLADRFYVVGWDLRGHGLSDKPADPAAYSPQHWADDLRAVIAALGLDRPWICAWSLGAYVLRCYLHAYGQRALAGLILVAPALDLATLAAYVAPEILEMEARTCVPDAEMRIAARVRFVEALTLAPRPLPEVYAAVGYTMLAAGALAAIPGPPPDGDDGGVSLLRGLTLPTLVIQGQQDPLAPPAYTDTLCAALPQAAVRHYERCGHSPFVEQPARFNRDVRTFIARYLSPARETGAGARDRPGDDTRVADAG